MTTKAKTNGNKADAKSVLDLNVDDLSLGDCIDVEEITGEPVFLTFAAAQAGGMSAKAMTALVWVTKRRDDPTFTFEDAKGIRVSALTPEDEGAGEAQG